MFSWVEGWTVPFSEAKVSSTENNIFQIIKMISILHNCKRLFLCTESQYIVAVPLDKVQSFLKFCTLYCASNKA